MGLGAKPESGPNDAMAWGVVAVVQTHPNFSRVDKRGDANASVFGQ